jgi:hypothetical protein
MKPANGFLRRNTMPFHGSPSLSIRPQTSVVTTCRLDRRKHLHPNGNSSGRYAVLGGVDIAQIQSPIALWLERYRIRHQNSGAQGIRAFRGRDFRAGPALFTFHFLLGTPPQAAPGPNQGQTSEATA